MSDTRSNAVAAAATEILSAFARRDGVPREQGTYPTDSPVGRLLIRATAVLIADTANAREAEERQRFAAETLDKVTVPHDDIRLCLRAAVDALVGVHPDA